MQRIRTVKPELFHHEHLYDAEVAAGLPLRLAFVGLWTTADREGRFLWRPRTLKGAILPFDRCDFEDVLNTLEAAGFIGKYEVEGETYGLVFNFVHHQRIDHREKASKLPPPPPELQKRVLPPRKKWRPPEPEVFIPPTLTEIQTYFQQLGQANYLHLGQRFINNYETTGWVRGKSKTPMKSWKAAARAWVATERPPKKPAAAPPPRAPDPEPTPEELEKGRKWLEENGFDTSKFSSPEETR